MIQHQQNENPVLQPHEEPGDSVGGWRSAGQLPRKALSLSSSDVNMPGEIDPLWIMVRAASPALAYHSCSSAPSGRDELDALAFSGPRWR